MNQIRLQTLLYCSFLLLALLLFLTSDGARIALSRQERDDSSSTTTTTTESSNDPETTTQNSKTPEEDLEKYTGFNEAGWRLINEWIDTSSELKSGWIFSIVLLVVAIFVSLFVCLILTCTSCFSGGGAEESGRRRADSPSILSSAFGTSSSRASSMAGRSSAG